MTILTFPFAGGILSLFIVITADVCGGAGASEAKHPGELPPNHTKYHLRMVCAHLIQIDVSHGIISQFLC
jgi:hypothetical protein